MAHLSLGKINVGLLRESARRELLQCIDACPGTKGVVWDNVLTGPFGLIAEYALLKDHDVLKMLPLQRGSLPPHQSINSIVFITRPQLPLMHIIAENVKQFSRRESERAAGSPEFHLIFVPKKSLLCQACLKELGVFGTFASIQELPVDMFPIDSDIISMDWDSAFKECYLENDLTCLQSAARSIMSLQALYGIIPNIYGKGKCAQHVYDLLMRMRRELMGNDPQTAPQIDTLVLLDRNVDLISPLVTQLTYEGLLDETYGINNTIVKLPGEKFASAQAAGSLDTGGAEPKTVVLNSGEELFAELRDKNFNAVGPCLSRTAKVIMAQFEERHGAKTVGEMKQFVAKLPHLQTSRQSLTTHTSIAELLKQVTDTDQFMETLQAEQDFLNAVDTDKPSPYVEECLNNREPVVKVLRLMCLQSIANNGLKPKVLDQYKQEITQTYGFEHVFTLQALEKLGMLKASVGSSRTYGVLRKTLRLTTERVDEQNPTDIAYVHSGYAPLSVRLVQSLHRPGWRAVTDVLATLPGPTVQEVQPLPAALRKRRDSGGSLHSSGGDENKVVLVFFLGGCTLAEISALRFLSQQDESCEYVIATTKIINGNSFIKSLM